MKTSLVPLKKIVKIHYGKALKAGDRDETGQFPVFGSSGQVGTHDKNLIDYPTLIIGRKGSVGKVTYAESGGWAIDTAFYTEFIQANEVDLRYFFYALKNTDLARWTITTSIPGLNRDDLYSTEISLPPLEEQKRIAAILDKADRVRRKRQEAIRLTEELGRSIFLDMFGDPVTNPRGWKIVKLNDVCNRITDGTHQSPTWSTEGIPFLFVSNIVDGEIDFNVSKYIDNQSWKDLTSRCLIELNDILYTTVGSYGNAALVRTTSKFCFQRHIAHIKPNISKIHPEFLLGLMQSDGIRKQADRQARGVAQKTLNLRELKAFQVFLPPTDLQEKYVSTRKRTEMQLKKQKDALKESENLFNSLLQRAFRGEL
ncbi:restriction endonuclease subunit S [Chamaesiphon sp. VAR_48_metabat_135_sub]|uniref:restriction endonuclease subunit S n=1 Tax=Chamaesiphon sp. VAR_48_metabat_135_sub TaxID=2964699 RepID=UPI00286A26BD|nr:restriction endonuclease subunit S [Chamaesiphon sp. VAR_48_metabat_135_sub]